jgi:hypothetical protein
MDPLKVIPGHADPSNDRKAIMPKDKSVGASLVLTFFFGPLGMLYSTVIGGLVMMFIAIVVALLTVGFGLLLVWPVTMVWGAIAASNAHSKHQAWLADKSLTPSPAQPPYQMLVPPGPTLPPPPT